MKTTIYLIVKHLTLPGAFMQAFFEHLACRMDNVLIEDGRYLRANEMCGHIEHELVRKRSVSFSLCFFPFLFNLLIGLVLTGVGSVDIYYLGVFFAGPDPSVPNLAGFLFLWLGISCLTNIFPQPEDAITLRELLYGADGSNLFVKIVAAPIFGILYAGAWLQSVGLTLVTSVAFSFCMPALLGSFVPQLFAHLGA